jgi:Flp pilus assembly protein TadG
MTFSTNRLRQWHGECRPGGKRGAVPPRSQKNRGQALFETAIAMPLFLIGLFGVMWAMKDASLSVRAQEAVRYGGMVDSLQQPYDAYSIYEMYATIDNYIPPPNATCYSGDTSAFTAGYHSFWLPTSTGVVTPCVSAIAIVSSPETYTQPVILRNNYSSISATSPVSGYLSTAALHGVSTTTVRAAENFFRSPEVGALLTCTTLGAAIKGSLEGFSDKVVPSSLTTAMPTVMPTPTTVVNGTAPACAPTTATFTAPALPY